MRLVRRFFASAPCRAITLLLISISRTTGRVASFARSRALFSRYGDEDVYCHWSTEVTAPERITFGKRVVIGPHCTIGAKAGIFIGDDVLFSKGVFVHTGTADISTPPPYARMAKPIRIERGVWLGAYSMVLAGVTIGENSIVAAGVVVRKSVPPGSFVVDERPRVQPFASSEH
jgi:acetyltransferase-like isoleucine patch superfamily enzyme